MATPPPRLRPGRGDRAVVGLLAALAYIPILLTRPGWVSADTKSYLTLDPGRLLERAGSMWDPWVGAGTITHQNIGYLFPLGPYYWAMDRVGVPDWITQRLLWGTLVFAAAVGVWKLCRWLGWATLPALVAALAYAFTPYLLSYLARLSVILGPWAAMPWLIRYLCLAVRERGWKWPARFAVVLALVGSSNATALLLVGIAPALWIAADLVTRRIPVRRVLDGLVRAAVLSLGVSVWWINGLRIQGSYGLPILRYTETYETVATAATPAELSRGLGYWFFYGGDRVDRWVGPSLRYTSSAWLIVLGFVIAALSLAGLLVRHRGRGRAVLMLVVGLAVSAGANPATASPYAWLFERFTRTTSGMAMRSTPRALPLVVLALAFGLGSLCAAFATRVAVARPRWPDLKVRRAVFAGAAVLIVAQMWPWFSGRVLTPSLLRHESLPAYETDLVNHLSSTGTARVYELPGADFANYRWGGTVDPALPGLIDRPYLSKELVPQGSPATADLLNALERRFYEGWFEPASLRPVSDLFGVGTVVTRNDIEYERYRLAQPSQLYPQIEAALGAPAMHGPLESAQPKVDMVDEQFFAHPRAEYPTVAAFDIDPGRSLIDAHPASDPIVLAGDGDGIVDAAAAGLLDGKRAIIPAAGDASVVEDAVGRPGAWLLVTDTNRKRALRWSSIGSNQGALETADQAPTDDPTDNRLDVYTNGDSTQRTVLETTGDLAAVDASGYGNRFTYTPEDAPANAIDGDPATAWRGAVFQEAVGLHLDISLGHPVQADSITLTQPQRGVTSRWITTIRLDLDGVSHTVELDESSRSSIGQRIPIDPARPFQHVRITVLADNLGRLVSYDAQPGVGIAEVTIPGVEMGTTVRLPSALLDRATTAEQRLTMVLTRQRIDPATHNRYAPESSLRRRFTLPAQRRFTLSGQARLAADAPDEVTTALLPAGGVTALADRRLPGAAGAGGAAAVDGDLGTAWLTPFDSPTGAELTIHADQPMGGQTWRMVLGDPGQYSSISALSLIDEAGTVYPLSPATGVQQVTIPESVGTTLRVRIEAVEPRYVADYFSDLPMALPTAIVEFSPQSVASAPSAALGECRDDLVTLDGRPLPVRFSGQPTPADATSPMAVSACDGAPITLDAGTHEIAVQPGHRTGIDLDRVILDSAAATAPAAQPAELIRSVEDGHDHYRVGLDASTVDSWVVLRQSWNPGWRATLDGHDLGPPTLIDGYASGWKIPAGAAGRVLVIDWTPQQSVRFTLWISLVIGSVTAVLALGRGRQRGRDVIHTGASRRPAWTGGRKGAAIAVVGIALVAGWVSAVAALAILAAPRALRRLLAAAAVGLILVVGAAVAWGQLRNHYPPGADWPARFTGWSWLVWVAIGAVAGLAAAELAAHAGEEQAEMGGGDSVPAEVGRV